MFILAFILAVTQALAAPEPVLDGALELRDPKGKVILSVLLSRVMCEAGGNTPVFVHYEGGTIQLEVTCPDNEETVLRIQNWEPSAFMAWPVRVQNLRGKGNLALTSAEWLAVPAGVKAPSLTLTWN